MAETLAETAFNDRYCRPPAIVTRAPGRVNLIGEHVDYNDGFVLPMAIDRRVVACLGRSANKWCRVASDSEGMADAEFDLDSDLHPGEPAWANYVKGVVAGFQARDIEIPPFEMFFDSDLPAGAGLSSSAALEVATATALEALTGQQLPPEEKALLCQKAEHDFAGVPCGIMDQFAVTMAREGHLLLLDCRTRAVEHIPFQNPDIAVVIANTNVKHDLADGEYAKRREQCQEAARILGVDSLRDATWIDLEMAKARLGDEIFRRARHVVTEIDRTKNCANRLRAGEWTAVASLLFSSHGSLRDDYEVSSPELDTMVDIARGPDFDGLVYGSRMTGGGFGGSTVSLVHRSILDRFIETLGAGYREATGIDATIFATTAVSGALESEAATPRDP